MEVPNELRDYATRIGFGDSETMAEMYWNPADELDPLANKAGWSHDENR